MKLNVILINPWITSVNQSQVETTDIQSLYKIMGWLDHRVQDVMVAATFPNGDNLLVQKTVDGAIPGFRIGSHRVHGCGVLLGNNDGQWASPIFMLTEVQDYVRFTNVT